MRHLKKFNESVGIERFNIPQYNELFSSIVSMSISEYNKIAEELGINLNSESLKYCSSSSNRTGGQANYFYYNCGNSNFLCIFALGDEYYLASIYVDNMEFCFRIDGLDNIHNLLSTVVAPHGKKIVMSDIIK